jgi:hypothetical protein
MDQADRGRRERALRWVLPGPQPRIELIELGRPKLSSDTWPSAGVM